jgi:site-specific recombinase XerD
MHQKISDVFRSKNKSTSVGTRNFSMLMLFLDSSLRWSELGGFTLDDINMDGRYPKVMGKGGKERIVPFGASTEKALLRYSLRFRPEPFNPTFRYFFLTPDGKNTYRMGWIFYSNNHGRNNCCKHRNNNHNGYP